MSVSAVRAEVLDRLWWHGHCLAQDTLFTFSVSIDKLIFLAFWRE